METAMETSLPLMSVHKDTWCQASLVPAHFGWGGLDFRSRFLGSLKMCGRQWSLMVCTSSKGKFTQLVSKSIE